MNNEGFKYYATTEDLEQLKSEIDIDAIVNKVIEKLPNAEEASF
jgi:hypothetical protein